MAGLEKSVIDGIKRQEKLMQKAAGVARSKLCSLVEFEVNESLQRLSRHPFVVEAKARRLSTTLLERWMKCAGRESKLFPSVLANMVRCCTSTRIRQVLSENLDDECGNGDPERAHFNLFLQLLCEVGIPEEAFYDYQEQAGVRFACDLARNMSCQSNLGITMGYMLINEGVPQITFSAVQHALLAHYPSLKSRFFELHITTDERHVQNLYATVDELNPSQETEIRYGISLGERGTAVLLDEAFGLFDHLDRTCFQ
jgi:pyrroloquinoline quinone (PQQ) biosynthesis protein C